MVNVPVMIYVIFIGSFFNFFLSLTLGNPIQSLIKINNFELLALNVDFPGGVLMMYCWGKALQLITPTQAAISLGLIPCQQFYLDRLSSMKKLL